ncbi:EAL domain-containing protein [Telmatobacter bradus]|uniref:EAL domain-containing protein n=1 Tax=Telmatobacter bradus TaxID=474953 RepID=UPI003B42C53A
MPTLRQRIFTIFSVTLCAGILGILAGNAVARAVTARIMNERLDRYASQLIADEEAAATELRTALAAVDASEHQFCSPAEISYLRALIFESQSLKDAGRIRNGSIACSAALGRLDQATAMDQPLVTQQDGTTVYRDLAFYQNSGLSTFTLQRDNSFVVYTPQTRLHLEPAPLHYVETSTDAPTQKRSMLLGEAAKIAPEILASEGTYRVGDTLYATRCSIRFFDCVTTWVALPDAIAANRISYNECVVLISLLSALTAGLMALLYRRNKSLEQQLRRAVRKGQIRVVYQPIVDLQSGKTMGAEALSRWTDEDGHTVRPDEFIAIAEKRGFVTAITRHVIGQVLSDFGATLRTDTDFNISVNLSTADLEDPAFPEFLDASLRREGVAAKRLTLEITESSTVQKGVAIEAIRHLRKRGHRVHIDDFGTGYSSLSYLQDLAVDAIKIDQSFTRAIGTGSLTQGLIPQILAIVETLHLNVVVEGVETEEQASYFAATEQPVLVQGWLFGRPQPLAEFIKLRAEIDKKQLSAVSPELTAV